MSLASYTNKTALRIGAANGLNVALSGMAVGGGFGAIAGSVSDHDTMLSGAIKGGMVGLPFGAGVKYVGSRYSKGFINAKGTDAMGKVLDGSKTYGWNTDYLTNGQFSGKEHFMDRFPVT